MATDACTKPARLNSASVPAPLGPERVGHSGAAEAEERESAAGGLGLSRAVETARSAIGRAVELELLNDLRIKGVLSDCDHKLNCTVTAASTETAMLYDGPCMGWWAMHGMVGHAWDGGPCMGWWAMHGMVGHAWDGGPCMG
ncbi:unnamed protein product [Closterium sp. Yama58-4]|nr:unnamed protein product [Closterium sp. Yama58-4]